MVISEIFNSISGEVCSFGQGRTCTFIRTAGCNLECRYCDTPKTQNMLNGRKWKHTQILGVLDTLAPENIIITGGEPLVQMHGTLDLLESLWVRYSDGRLASSFIVVETNGTIPVPHLSKRIKPCWVVDYKLDYPDQMQGHEKLKEDDFIKFVLSGGGDVPRAFAVQKQLQKYTPAKFAYSIINDGARSDGWEILPKDVFTYGKSMGLEFTMNMQIHKFMGLA